jgi:hypothetical protein
VTYNYKCQKHDDCLINTKLADWKILNGCFREEPAVGASDIDGVVCQNGSVLFLEKKSTGVQLSWPQIKMFRTLAAQGNSVVVGWWDQRDASDLHHLMTWNLPPFQDEILKAATRDDLLTVVRDLWWLRHYNGRNR